MTSISLIDPSLKDSAGHMLGQACGLDDALRAAGCTTEIVGHRLLDKHPELEGRQVVRHFSVSPYHAPSRDLVGARMENMAAVAPRLADELGALLAEPDRRHCVFPTVNLPMLRAFADFAVRNPGVLHDPERSFHLFFYLECGVALDEADRPMVDDSLLAWETRRAFRDLAALAPTNLHLRAVSPEMATLYGLASGGEFRSVMPYHGARPEALLPLAEARRPGPARILAYGGQASSGKGFLRLPDLLGELRQRLPDAELVVQLHRTESREAISEAADRVRQSAAELRVSLREGFLPEAEMQALVADCDVVIVGYDRRHYRGKTSGFLWDSVRAGALVVTAAGTWAAREALAFGAPLFAYGAETAEAAAAAAAEAARAAEAGPLRPQAIQAAQRYRALAGPDALVRDHLRGVLGLNRAPRRRPSALFDLVCVDFASSPKVAA
jgi:glycosyltransferase involved in cell wall biosynthesis